MDASKVGPDVGRVIEGRTVGMKSSDTLCQSVAKIDKEESWR